MISSETPRSAKARIHRDKLGGDCGRRLIEGYRRMGTLARHAVSVERGVKRKTRTARRPGVAILLEGPAGLLPFGIDPAEPLISRQTGFLRIVADVLHDALKMNGVADDAIETLLLP